MSQSKRSDEQVIDDTVCEQVVAAVADALDTDPLELPPLYEVIDPDALDHLFDTSFPNGRRGPGRVMFTLAGCEVVVHSDGAIGVTAPQDQSPAPSTIVFADERVEAETTLE